ncbi:hypothetical protein Tco_1459218 [Tanacetum coccineum]
MEKNTPWVGKALRRRSLQMNLDATPYFSMRCTFLDDSTNSRFLRDIGSSPIGPRNWIYIARKVSNVGDHTIPRIFPRRVKKMLPDVADEAEV